MNKIEIYQEGKTFKNLELEGNSLLGVEFVDCVFEDTIFDASKFKNTKFIDCQFINSRITNSIFKNTSMKDSSFTNCHLVGVNWNKLLAGGYSLPIASLKDSELVYNNFMDIDFYKFNFSSNNIRNSFFADCDLSEANFSDCELEGTEFFKCNLMKTDFKDSSGYIIDIGTNEVKGARFSYPGVMNLLASLEIVID